MEYKNQVEFCVYGRKALFSDPITRVGGEKCSYPVPTYQALKGIIESCYWKPTIIWYIDAVRIMKPIMTQSEGIRTVLYAPKGKTRNDLSIYTYLTDVKYNVKAHFEWNMNRTDLASDRNENKHYFIAKRMIERGGRRDIFLGTRECQGYIEPCEFEEGESPYDKSPPITFGVMFHSFSYPDENGQQQLLARLWQPVMENGVITFIRPEDCTITRIIKSQPLKQFTLDKNCQSCGELANELGFKEEMQ